MTNHNPQNPQSNSFLSRLWNLVTNDRIANFLSIYPVLANLFVVATPIVLLTLPGWISSILNAQINSDYKKKICEDSKSLVEERLKLEKKLTTIATIDRIFPEDKTVQKFRLPFSCKYMISQNQNNSVVQEIYLEITPLFTDLTQDISNDYEEKIDFEQVCKHPTIKKQMETAATKERYYDPNRKDEILPGYPELLFEDKKQVYPVFRWRCTYDIKKQGENSPFKLITKHKIDIRLEDYCEDKSKNKSIKRLKPTHHHYKDPYSLYCVNPHAE
ncbi:MAG: hypothetical protein ACFKPT_00180 [Gloeotrichia echinulata GP01]